MSGLLVISDPVARQLLMSLSRTDIMETQSKIAESLRSFSVGAEGKYQPESSVIHRPNGQKTLFRPFTSPSSVGTKIIVDPAPSPSGEKGPLRGIVAVCDDNGYPTGIIDAEELTGFRTTLSALIPYMWRKKTDRIFVFGAGKQALWHIRLALALRGDEIESIVLTNRSAARAEALIIQLNEENSRYWKSSAKIELLSSASPEYEQTFERELSSADVIFCTVPSTKPLFASHQINNDAGMHPLITAIGSWQSNMMEVDPDLIRRIAKDKDSFNPRGFDGGTIIVDDRQSAYKDAGEVVESEVGYEALVEIGDILELLRQDRPGGSGPLQEWLANGLVIYKSVGVGITDLIAANAMLELARRQNVGVNISKD